MASFEGKVQLSDRRRSQNLRAQLMRSILLTLTPVGPQQKLCKAL